MTKNLSLPADVRVVARVYNYAGLVFVTVKFWADYRKHAACGGPHNQKCDCFGACLPCATEALTARKSS